MSTAITGLPPGGAIAGTEQLPMVQGGVTVRNPASALATYIGAVGTSITPNVQTGTTYTLLTTDRSALVSLSNASGVSVTLPQAGTDFPNGWFVLLENVGAGTVTITPTTSTIDGAASLTLATDQGVVLASDGTNYYTMRGRGASAGGGSAGTALVMALIFGG